MKNWEPTQYCGLINKILDKGHKRKTRAGDAYSIFGEMITIDIETEFPLLNGRKMFYRPVLGELAAFLKGPKTGQDFKEMGCNYWDSWVDQAGDINIDYGNIWKDFNGVNQLEVLVKQIKEDPYNRRMLISGWDPSRLPYLSLPCCHMLYQWYVRDDKFLDMVWYQRSVDTMVGLPSDIILAAAWNIILATQTNLRPGIIKLILGDTHIYANHLAPTLDYLRQVNQMTKIAPTPYIVVPDTSVFNFKPDHIQINHYNPMPQIKFELNV